MATALKKPSPSAKPLDSASGYRFGVVVSEWNPEVTEALYQGAAETLLRYGVKEKNIIRVNVPGSFELTYAAALLADKEQFDAIICLGCVIQGETRHFDFICEAVANGLTNVGIRYNKPVIFGVLTTNNLSQARERAGGKLGNKGEEAAETAVKMAVLSKKIKKI